MIGSLIKGILLFGLSGLVAYGLVQISNASGHIKINIDNNEISISLLTGILAVTGCFLGITVLIYIIGFGLAFLKFVSGDETAITRYFDRSRKVKGYDELSNALVSLYEGNKRGALYHSNRAKKLLDSNKLSILINTQIAHQTGEKKLALANYKKLLLEKDTKLVALSGIVSEKIKSGDISQALKLAKKSFELNSKNLNVLTTLFNLQIQENDWSGAQNTFQVKRKLQKIPREVFLRQEAILIFAEAREKRSLGHIKEALSRTLIAVRQYPDFIAALTFLAELEVLSGNKKRIEKFLKKAWALFPHPEIAKAFASLNPDENPIERLKRFESFIKINSKHVQTAILSAELYMAADDFTSAKKAIGMISLDDPDNRVLTLMALVERGCGAKDEVVRGWLTKAVYAPKAPDWICDECGAQTQWNPVCSSCDGFDTIRWKRPPVYRETVDRKKLLPLVSESGANIEPKNQAEKIDLEYKESETNNLEEGAKKNIDNELVKKAREVK